MTPFPLRFFEIGSEGMIVDSEGRFIDLNLQRFGPTPGDPFYEGNLVPGEHIYLGYSKVGHIPCKPPEFFARFLIPH